MIELRQDQTVSFSWYDGGGLVPASVTAQLIDRKGGVLATGSVTLPTASTTVLASLQAVIWRLRRKL
jgi:hypothetical protein